MPYSKRYRGIWWGPNPKLGGIFWRHILGNLDWTAPSTQIHLQPRDWGPWNIEDVSYISFKEKSPKAELEPWDLQNQRSSQNLLDDSSKVTRKGVSKTCGESISQASRWQRSSQRTNISPPYRSPRSFQDLCTYSKTPNFETSWKYKTNKESQFGIKQTILWNFRFINGEIKLEYSNGKLELWKNPKF